MRKARYLEPGATYHVIARINNRDYRIKPRHVKMLFMQILCELQQKMQFGIEHFTLMNNHVHLIIRTIDLELPTIMKRLLMTFTIRYNKQKNRSGHLWGDRYYSEILKTYYDFCRCFHYISNNPVKAKLVKTPEEWEWSGLSFYKNAFDLVGQWISTWAYELYNNSFQILPMRV